MAYVHGVQTSETPTSILPPVQSSAGIPFIVGTAPVNMTDVSNVNKPKLCYSYSEAVKEFGYAAPVADSASGLKKHEYTISEFIKSHFAFFQSAPVVIVNVLDPATMTKTVTTTKVTFDSQTGMAKVEETGIILDSVTLDSADKAGEKFTASFDDDGYLVLGVNKNAEGEDYYERGTEISFTANKLDPSQVEADDIIGGVSTSGVKTGLELVEEVFPRFRVVPGVLLAPYFSANTSVASALSAKASNINGVFQAGVALIDAPTDSDNAIYSGVPSWKTTNNIVNANQVVLWPRVNNDGVIYSLSTQAAGIIAQTDGDNEDVPYVSPSNKNLTATGTVLDDGTEVYLDQSTAAYLNGNGIVTGLNFIGGWKLWGNRTACYPDNTDVKDAFIPIRRMFVWVANTLIQNYWANLDMPLNRRQIDTILDSANLWLNGLAAKQYILGGRVEFLDDENSTEDLMDGKAKFHVYITPPSPNKEINFTLEYNPDYLSNLFE